MICYTTDTFSIDLPLKHKFKREKYSLLRKKIENSDFKDLIKFRIPYSASITSLKLAHSIEFIEKYSSGSLTKIEKNKLGVPWSKSLVTRSRRGCGAILSAIHHVKKEKVIFCNFGGTHHASHNSTWGFCIFNDLAVGSIYALNKGFFKKIAIIDLDVHKGDGTAEICSKFDNIITYSVHSEKNMAFGKKPSNFDVSLPSNVTQDEYIATVLNVLDSLDDDIELILYNAGADCYKNDLIGKMNLEKRTLKKRDKVVYDFCFNTCKNIVTVLGGGYAKNIKDTVDIYYNTFTESFNLWKNYRG